MNDAIDRIKAIHARIPNTHLVMHGSSSVPQDLLQIIRDNGGDMKETYGVPVEEIARLASHASSRTTEVVYRRELRPVITTGAEVMDQIFQPKHRRVASAEAAG